MKTIATPSTVFYVSPAPNGGWAVFGSEISPPLSTFAVRGAALRHAEERAEQAALGEVQVLDWNGSVEEYVVHASASEGRPACRRAISA